MMTWSNLIAEQSAFASIQIDRIAAIQNNYQQNMVDVAYMKNNASPKSNVDHTQYRITNMPDTIAYIPKNSVFENIILFHAELADFRFVPINRSTTMGVRTTDTIPSVVINNQIQPVDSYFSAKPKVTTNMFTTSLGSQQTVTDPIFDDIGGDVSRIQNYPTLRANVAGYVNKNGGNMSNTDWVNDLYAHGQYTQDFVNMVLMSNSQLGNNMDTMTIRVIDSLKNVNHDSEITSDTLSKVFAEIKRALNEHMAMVRASQIEVAEQQRQLMVAQLTAENASIVDSQQPVLT